MAFCNFEQGCTEWSPKNGFDLYGTAATGWPAWCENCEDGDDANTDMSDKNEASEDDDAAHTILTKPNLT